MAQGKNFSAQEDVLVFAQEAARAGLIHQSVLDHLTSLHPKVPNSMKHKYLMMRIRQKIKDDEELFVRMVQVFLKFGSEIRFKKNVEADDTIDPQHVHKVTEFLNEYSYKWREIGQALKFKPQDLHTIQACPALLPSAPQSYLTRIVEEWVLKKFNHTRVPTLSALEGVLASRTVGLGHLVKEVQVIEEYILTSKEEAAMNYYVCFTIQLQETAEDNLKIFCSSNVRKNFHVEESKALLLEVSIISENKEMLPQYQWLKDDKALKDNEHYSGSTASILCIAKADISMDGCEYSCEIQISGNTIKTGTIILRVDCILDEFSGSLSVLYHSKPEVPEDTWPPVSNTKYINLAMIKQAHQLKFGTDYAHLTIQGDIDDIFQHKEKIEFNEVVESLKVGQVIFIEGRPGSGKTTFVNKITQKWSLAPNGAMRLVMMVSLRVLNNLNKSKLDLSDILELFKDLKITKKLIEERDGKGVCFIFDGLDEFSPRNGIKSVVYKIINKEYLSHATVIVASRPAALAKIRIKATKVYEVLGFLKNQILEYFDYYPFSDYVKPEALKRYLSSHPNILHMCYLPIHAAMVAFLFQVTGEVPQTETEIYTHFTRFTVMRSISKRYNLDFTEDFESFECDDIYEKYLGKICKLALEKTISNKQVLHQDEVKSYFSIKESEDISLGLVTVDRTAGLYGFKNIYTFLHLTFQEYLAACYISTLNSSEQNKLIQMHGNKDHMLVVWKFYCGLVRSRLQQNFVSIFKRTGERSLFHFQCAYESQDQTTCDHVLNSAGGHITISDKYLTTQDFTAIGFVTSRPSSPVELTLACCNINIEPINSIYYPNILKISMLQVDVAPNILDNVLKFCSNLQELALIGTIKGVEAIKIFATNLNKYTNLKELDISDNSIGNEGAILLADGLKFCSKLERLNLACNYISAASGAFAAIFTALKENRLKIRCDDLFYRNDITGEDLISCMGNCINLQSLHITIDSSSIKPFLLYCRKWEKLKKLNLRRQKFLNADIGQAMAGCHFTTLEELSLVDCKIGTIGAQTIAKTLSVCSSLQTLNLSLNCIEKRGARAIFDVLQHNRHLCMLNLSANLIEAISPSYPIKYVSLQVLNLGDNKIQDEGAKDLSASLPFCVNLRILSLFLNEIKYEGARALSSCLKHCCKLQELNLGANRIGEEGAKSLATNLHHIIQLEKLDLHHNGINDDGAKAILTSLRRCPNFKTLNLFDNFISDKFASILKAKEEITICI